MSAVRVRSKSSGYIFEAREHKLGLFEFDTFLKWFKSLGVKIRFKPETKMLGQRILQTQWAHPDWVDIPIGSWFIVKKTDTTAQLDWITPEQFEKDYEKVEA